ncbi:MAG: hypothetical protein KatS3mg105_2704 [Gemmatales bacterium]|nr:MAG: hypothetical protein KatS3mg105_2704 [Gemmatales bacterium]
MPKSLTRTLVVALLLSFFPAAGTVAADPDVKTRQIFEKMLSAAMANDRDAFVQFAIDPLKEAITKDVMASVHETLGARLKKGYRSFYLCQLKQRGLAVHLWKLTFKDDGDDVLIRLSLRDGKVEGFFFE